MVKEVVTALDKEIKNVLYVGGRRTMVYQKLGLEEKHEHFYAHILRDTRTLSVRIADFLKNLRWVVTACDYYLFL